MRENQAKALELIGEIKAKLANRQRILEFQRQPAVRAMQGGIQAFWLIQEQISGVNKAIAKAVKTIGAELGKHDQATKDAAEIKELAAMIKELDRLEKLVRNDQ
jgi:hypothetical protein